MTPTFNHSRGDSPLTPCPICAEQMHENLKRKPPLMVLDIPKAAGNVTVEIGVKIKGLWRVRLGLWFVKLGIRIAGAGVKVEE